MMKYNRRRATFRLWLAAPLVYLLLTAIVLRPDRDVARYLESAKVEEMDPQSRANLAYVRQLRGEGLTPNQVKAELRKFGPLPDGYLIQLIRHDAALKEKDHLMDHLILFAIVSLLPMLILLELGVVIIGGRQGRRVLSKLLRT
jgi:hypothetical protein